METINLLDDQHDQTGTAGITGDMLEDLNQTSSWLRYLGILGMLLSVLLVIVIFISFFAMTGINPRGIYPGAGVLVAVFFVLVMFVGTGFISLLLYRYGNNLKKYVSQKEVRYFAEAANNNKSIWMILGVLFTVGTILLLFIFLYSASVTGTI